MNSWPALPPREPWLPPRLNVSVVSPLDGLYVWFATPNTHENQRPARPATATARITKATGLVTTLGSSA